MNTIHPTEVAVRPVDRPLAKVLVAVDVMAVVMVLVAVVALAIVKAAVTPQPVMVVMEHVMVDVQDLVALNVMAIVITQTTRNEQTKHQRQ